MPTTPATSGAERAWSPHFSDEAVEEARAALDRLSILSIAPVSINAVLHDGIEEPASDARASIAMGYHRGPGSFANVFEFEFEVLNSDRESLATLAFTLRIGYAVDDETFEVTDAAAGYLTATTGLFGAYPYARELAQNLTMRLGLDPLVIGLLRRDELHSAEA